MERVGIIDLGSNSVRLVIIDIKDNKAHHQIESLKETVRLESGIDPQGTPLAAAIDNAIDAVSLFVKFCRARGVASIIAVATAAVRRAPNKEEIISRVEERTGIKVRVLSGEEEAHLGYIGLVNTAPQREGLMADLGGGSLKLVSFENRLIRETFFLDFGAVSLMEKFDLADRPSAKNLKALNSFLEDRLACIPWLGDQRPLIGLGGTCRSLARVYRQQTNYLPDITDGLEIGAEKASEIYGTLAEMNLEKRRAVPGLAESRADISVAGFALINKLLEATGSTRLFISTASIRDGLFFQHLYPRDPIVFNVLTHHTKNLIDYYNLDENHLHRVSNFAVTLFDQLQPLHKLGSSERRLLLIAGLLHELGVVISVEGLERHTLYTVLHAPLRGLTHQERILAAYLAASHEQIYLGGLRDHISRGSICLADVQRINKLTPLLQIAHSLDRSRLGVVTQVHSTLTDDTCEIRIAGNGKRDLEIKDASRRADTFLRQFGVELKIVKD